MISKFAPINEVIEFVSSVFSTVSSMFYFFCQVFHLFSTILLLIIYHLNSLIFLLGIKLGIIFRKKQYLNRNKKHYEKIHLKMSRGSDIF